jgi:basic amino acid/polyamine antiporter, APA family
MKHKAALHRSLSLSQMVLYGIGTTVGAGIYALIGEIAEVAGMLAPWSFLVAAFMAAFTAFSFAQLSARFPRAAGAALYVEKGFGWPRLAQLVGILVITAGIVSSAALLNGFVGYLQTFIDVDRVLIISVACVILCLISTWGISESVWVAGIISVVEVGGLVWITLLAGDNIDLGQVDFASMMPKASFDYWGLIFTGAVLSFYAYIGFEDMVEVAEEVRNVEVTLPRAILLTLALSTLIYLMLVVSLILAVGPSVLANSNAPLADAYHALTNAPPTVISVIGLFAIVNGALIQIIMASRVLYGLASRNQLPHILSWVHPRTQTPWVATATASSLVLLLALAGSLASLAEVTSVAMLCVFALANGALCRLWWAESKLKAIIGLIGAVICSGFAIQTVLKWIS